MKIILTILGEKYEQTGKTIEEALSKFDLEWQQIKGKGSMLITDGKRQHEHLYSMVWLRRIFNNKITRSIQAKNLEKLLK